MPQEAGLKYYEPKNLSPRHKHIVALHVAGLKNQEIAEVLDFSQSRVSVILNDPRTEAIKRDLEEGFISGMLLEAQRVLQGNAAKAARTMVHLMEHAESENVQLRASADILDRTGFKAKESITIDTDVLDAEAAKLLTSVFKETQREEEEIEFVEDTAGVFVQRGDEIPDA